MEEQKLEFQFKDRYDLEDLKQVTRILRSENGCPWDKVQTHQSIRQDFLEETLEALEAIDNQDPVLLREELGDVLFQVVFHAQIEAEQGRFDLADVIHDITFKLIHRHPHVFGSIQANTVDQVLKNWDDIKKEEKNQDSYADTLRAVPKTFPALMRAQKVQKRAAKVGFDFESQQQTWDALAEETQELKEAVEQQDVSAMEEELGDVLFSVVNLSRFLGLDAEKCLTNAVEKFINRFAKVEFLAVQQQLDLKQTDHETLESLYQQSKRHLSDNPTD